MRNISGRTIVLLIFASTTVGCGEEASEGFSATPSQELQFRDSGMNDSVDPPEDTNSNEIDPRNGLGAPVSDNMTDGNMTPSNNDATEPAGSGSSGSDERESEEDFPVFGDNEEDDAQDAPNPGSENGNAEDENAAHAADENDEPNPDEDAGDRQPPGECSLQLRAEVRDQDGPCIQCTAGQYITLYGVIDNPCDRPLTYRSEQSCTVASFTVTRLDSGSQSIYESTCGAGAQALDIPAGMEETVSRPAGRLSAGEFELRVQFVDAEDTTPVLRFSVE